MPDVWMQYPDLNVSYMAFILLCVDQVVGVDYALLIDSTHTET